MEDFLLRYPTALDLPEQQAPVSQALDGQAEPQAAASSSSAPGVSIDRRLFRPLRRRGAGKDGNDSDARDRKFGKEARPASAPSSGGAQRHTDEEQSGQL